MLQIALHVHLRLFALGRRRQRNHAKDARTHAFGDRLDRTAFARAVTPFEYDADLRAGVLRPIAAASPVRREGASSLSYFLQRNPVPCFGTLVFCTFSSHLTAMGFTSGQLAFSIRTV